MSSKTILISLSDVVEFTIGNIQRTEKNIHVSYPSGRPSMLTPSGTLLPVRRKRLRQTGQGVGVADRPQPHPELVQGTPGICTSLDFHNIRVYCPSILA